MTLKNKMVVFRGGAVCLSVDPLRHIFKKVLVKVVGSIIAKVNDFYSSGLGEGRVCDPQK